MLKEKLMEDLKNSMKEKNVLRKNVIQMVRAAILQIEKDKGIEVDDNKILEIISKEVKTRKDSLTEFEKAGNPTIYRNVGSGNFLRIIPVTLILLSSSMDHCNKIQWIVPQLHTIQ